MRTAAIPPTRSTWCARRSRATGSRGRRASAAGVRAGSRRRGPRSWPGSGTTRYGAQGGDWGSMISTQLGLADPEHLAGIHLNMVVAPPPADLDFEHLQEDEQVALATYELLRPGRFGLREDPGHQARRRSGTRSTTRRPGSRRGSSRSSARGATATATSSAASPRTSCSTTSCSTGSPAPRTRPGACTTRPSRPAGAVARQRIEVPVGVAAFPAEIIRPPAAMGGAPLRPPALDRNATWWALRGVRRARTPGERRPKVLPTA